MIENRDIHSYNCDVYITHEGEIYQVNVLDGLEIVMERKGSPSKCTFQIMQEDEGAVQFEEGDAVKVRISQRWMFYGFIFTKGHGADKVLKFTCYDQLRYLKAKESVVFVNKTVGEIVTALAKDRGLKLGTIRDSNYRIPTLTKENATMYDIIMTAIEETTVHTGEVFIFYDRCGAVTLCPLKHMFRNVIIDCDVIQDYDYESTIDKQTYNIVRVGYKSPVDGKLTYITARDQKNINKWGMLQLTETAENGWLASSKANQLLALYNSKTRTLKVKGAMGANEVVGGALILVKLDLGDIKLSQNMVVDAVTHRVEDGLYSMDLELIGGEFVSTRGVQQDEAQKKDESNINGANGSNQAKLRADWGHGVTIEAIRKELAGTRLEAYAEKILAFGHAYGFNPLIAIEIFKVESYADFHSGLAVRGNNFGGVNWTPKSPYPKIVMGGRAYVKYPSIEAGIEDNFRLLGKVYLHDRNVRKLNKIMGIYSPSFENDTSGYIRTLKNKYKKVTGLDWQDSFLGNGVSSVQDAKNMLATPSYSSIDNSRNSRNSTIEKAISYARSRVGMYYSQKDELRNSYLHNTPANAQYFDCSSLCFYSYVHAGYLKAGKNAMTTSSLHSNPEAYKMKKVPLSQAKRGDILWRQGHVGLYLGNGATVEANSPREGIKYHQNNLKHFNCAYRPYLAN